MATYLFFIHNLKNIKVLLIYYLKIIFMNIILKKYHKNKLKHENKYFVLFECTNICYFLFKYKHRKI